MIIFRYLTKEVYAAFLATILIVLLVVVANQLINYLYRAAAGGLPMETVLQLMSLEIPVLLGYLLPLALFLGILLAYGRLYTDHEMTVLSSCGFSKAQLFATTFLFSSLIVIVVAVLTLWIEPKVAWYRDRILAEAAVASPIETLFPGRFQSLDNGQWAMYVGEISRDHTQLRDVFIAKIPASTLPGKQEPWMIISSQGGHQWVDPKTQDQFIVLTHGHRYEGLPGQKDFQVVQYQQYGVQVQTGKLSVPAQSDFVPTMTLWQQRHKNRRDMVELQWRLVMPVSTMLLAWLAIPLSCIRPKKGRYAKLLPAILLYVIYANLVFVVEASVEHGNMAPLPGVWWVHLGMVIVCLIFTVYFVGWQSLKTIFRSESSA